MRARRDDLHRDSRDLWRLRCPECGGTAFVLGADLLCPSEGRCIEGRNGILTLLSRERRHAFEPFLEAYRTVRCHEGWSGGEAYYRGLPFTDATGRHRDVWRLRARSYRAALRAVESHFPRVKTRDEREGQALRLLELGAGNGWFAWRMAQRGHYVLATDVSDDEEDGLGAMHRYASRTVAFEARVTLARAEMERLPLDGGQFDVVVANGALHYAGSPTRAVAEVHRVLRPRGLFLVLDSPVYRREADGRTMLERRRREHQERFRIEDVASGVGFLVVGDFEALLHRAGFHVETRFVFEGLRRGLRRAYCRSRRLPAPARFPLFVAARG